MRFLVAALCVFMYAQNCQIICIDLGDGYQYCYQECS